MCLSQFQPGFMSASQFSSVRMYVCTTNDCSLRSSCMPILSYLSMYFCHMLILIRRFRSFSLSLSVKSAKLIFWLSSDLGRQSSAHYNFYPYLFPCSWCLLSVCNYLVLSCASNMSSACVRSIPNNGGGGVGLFKTLFSKWIKNGCKQKS